MLETEAYQDDDRHRNHVSGHAPLEPFTRQALQEKKGYRFFCFNSSMATHF
jgi:hypothetical protein